MSGECDDCGEHTLECSCESRGNYTLAHVCGSGCPCCQNGHNNHLNLVRNFMKEEPITADQLPEVKWVNVRGRVEHEAIIRDAEWCKDLGLDQAYEIMIYLKRWGSWLER